MHGVTRFSQLLLPAIAIGGDFEIITVVQYVLQLILCSFDLILPIYVFLHFSQLNGTKYGLVYIICIYFVEAHDKIS